MSLLEKGLWSQQTGAAKAAWEVQGRKALKSYTRLHALQAKIWWVCIERDANSHLEQ